MESTVQAIKLIQRSLAFNNHTYQPMPSSNINPFSIKAAADLRAIILNDQEEQKQSSYNHRNQQIQPQKDHLNIHESKEYLKNKFCEEINKSISRQNDQIILQILNRIPQQSQKQYYQIILKNISYQKLFKLAENIQIFIFLFKKICYFNYNKIPAQIQLYNVRLQALKLEGGFQRIQLLVNYLTPQQIFSQILNMKCYSYVMDQLNDSQLINKIIKHSVNKPTKLANKKHIAKNFIVLTNEVATTARIHSINQQQITNSIFGLKTMQQINKNIKLEINTNQQIIEILMNVSIYNPQLFWNECHQNQKIIEITIIKQLTNIHSNTSKCYSKKGENLEEYIYIFLQKINSIKAAKKMLQNILMALIKLTINQRAFRLLNNIISSNKFITHKIIPLVFEKIQTNFYKQTKKISQVTMRMLENFIIELLKICYEMNKQQFKKLINFIKEKSKCQFMRGITKRLIEFLQKRLQSDQLEQNQQSYFYKYYQLILNNHI